ncbi:LuxR C-terminal-related transcriptional regulator [Leifsonia sp. NPDC077715]|uniref:response regulator transcription factor n=1 Tax=Leifsonia sp. NPDC077715 TaxID=3155539 RepID=UPI00342FBC39
MLLRLTAAAVAACFCLSPTPLPEQIPVAPDAFNTPIRDVTTSDAVPQRCLTAITGRERAILSALAQGWRASRIAYELCISEGTVRKHIEHAYRKLGVNDRVLAAQRAVELNLV